MCVKYQIIELNLKLGKYVGFPKVFLSLDFFESYVNHFERPCRNTLQKHEILAYV